MAATRPSSSTRYVCACALAGVLVCVVRGGGECVHGGASPSPHLILQGYGTLLMEAAERIAREEHGSAKLAVISGVGTRHYYRKLGYTLDGPYMSKAL